MVSFGNNPGQGSRRHTLEDSADSPLSKSCKAWDLDGDGQLDEAELALKNMDKSNTGTLDKAELHKLMTENLNTQRELFKMKKVVLGLVGITCVLALANMATSFAAAALSKDTTTQGNAMINKSTGQAIKTDMYAHVHRNDEEATEARRLQSCATNAAGETACSFHGHVISREDGLALLAECVGGSDVDMQFTHLEPDGEHHHLLEQFCICPPANDGEAIYSLDQNNVPLSANITSASVGHTFWIRPDGDSYLVSWD